MISCGEVYVLLHLSRVGLFGTKGDLLHLENYDFQQLFLSTPNSLTTGK
jgi:hypothetical protein